MISPSSFLGSSVWATTTGTVCTVTGGGVLPSTVTLPADVAEGDWIEIDRVGAYSSSLATRFNGFYPETMVVVHDAPIGMTK